MYGSVKNITIKQKQERRWSEWEKKTIQCEVGCIKWKKRGSRCIWQGQNNKKLTQSCHIHCFKGPQCVIQTTWCLNVLHAAEASLLTLPLSGCYVSLHHFRAAWRQDRNTQRSLFQPRHVTARLEGQTDPHRALCLSPHEVWKPASPRQTDAKPCQATSRTSCMLPNDSLRFIVHRHKVFFSLLSDHRPMRLSPSFRV